MSEVITAIEQKLKPVPKFNSGHFPPGTIVTWENNFNHFLPVEERVYEGQMYDLTYGTEVVNCVSNGPGSWIIETTVPHLLKNIGGYTFFNIDWVRAIEKRGKDNNQPKLIQTNDLISDIVMRKDCSLIHNYDLDAIYDIVQQANALAPLSKKKMRKLVARIMSHHRVSTKVLVKADRDFWDSMYADE